MLSAVLQWKSRINPLPVAGEITRACSVRHNQYGACSAWTPVSRTPHLIMDQST